MTGPISLAHLSAIDLAPPDLVEAAARAGFDAVGLRLLRVTEDSPGYPLMHDPAARRATRRALGETGLAVSDIEFVRITPEFSVETLLPMLDCGAELGAGHVITACYDEDRSRVVDTLGAISAAAAERGVGTVLEFFPWTPAPDLAAAWEVVAAVGSNAGILVDSLHFDRSESSLDLLDRIPPGRLPFIHLCDAEVCPPYTTEQLLHAARVARLPPGEGQIPLGDLLTHLPDAIPVGVEVPSPRQGREAGDPARLSRLLAATRATLGRSE